MANDHAVVEMPWASNSESLVIEADAIASISGRFALARLANAQAIFESDWLPKCEIVGIAVAAIACNSGMSHI